MRTVVMATTLLSVLIQSLASAQIIKQNQAQKHFQEARMICDLDQGELWGVSLCGPTMFVDPQSRYIVANQADANGALRTEGNVFVGYLPRMSQTQPPNGLAFVGFRSFGLYPVTSRSETP